MDPIYDRIGIGYATRRRPDPRIAEALHAHLRGAESVVNVGAGTGSYEPDWCTVTAVEPSSEMISQRPEGAAPVVQARAENLPFEDDLFDAGLAVLTVHHWSDAAAGLRELRRVVRGPVVILTYDPRVASFWLLDYMPALGTLDIGQMPQWPVYEAALGPVDTQPLPIPRDCVDGFLCAYWQRPEAYLDPEVRRSISSFAKIGDQTEALAQLEADIESGAWARKYARFLEMDACDFGYRVVVAR